MKQILVLLLAFFISGCGIKPVKSGEYNQYFLIELSQMDVVNFANSGKIIKIQKPNGKRFINSKKIMYSEQKNELYPYAKSFWEEPLASQYVFLLRKSLEKSNLFKSVITSSSKLKPNLYLESNINSFKHIIRNEKSYVEFSISLSLIADDKLLSSRNFYFKKSTNSIDAKGAVWAYSLVFDEFIKEVKIWLNNNLE